MITLTTDFGTRDWFVGTMTGIRKVCCPLMDFYGAVPVNRPVAALASSGFMGIALNGGSATQEFGLKVGDKVIVRLKS
jgi:S-adenosylmethionine hydrolase